MFTVVAAVGSISVLGAIARRIAGPRGARRIDVLKGSGGSVIGLNVGGDTDPGHQDTLRQLAADLEAMRDEVAGLRREMDEALNRLDFTERLLGQARERGLLKGPNQP